MDTGMKTCMDRGIYELLMSVTEMAQRSFLQSLAQVCTSVYKCVQVCAIACAWRMIQDCVVHHHHLRSVSLCTMHHVPCIMHHASCTMHHASCTMHHASCTMHHAPCTIFFVLKPIHPKRLSCRRNVPKPRNSM